MATSMEQTLVMQALKVVYAVEAVEKAKKRINIDVPKRITFFSVNDEWIYTAVLTDNRVCDACLQYEFGTFTGNQLRSIFPYLEVISLEQIHPHTHPNCRCHLDRVLWWGDVGQEQISEE